MVCMYINYRNAKVNKIVEKTKIKFNPYRHQTHTNLKPILTLNPS